ncbi:SDR family oxidoreductase [Cytophaga hutchinsonii]|uniref:UDP-galactose-4-epimerase n=1 Tax=Cytophaga hutchinsonii (strain ATCC 33406 / DSM 1761 / CIP 103989 / NBRC 15051 / NCIMB 9469 / D465) TaxID=269798 RepID=A0A6N4SP60_CYTH3|nr:SDR family oxidoreductase [Cytophaga hutchinsonii]ABG58119.1 UDP-galactose-4-epimerase [Cytophaga hutchinsonii ATCC 33406]SFX13962.1 UDP-N-acetylglucosamine 4-epimerase [Cytophaga hutchinsonii ATCC 33406]
MKRILITGGAGFIGSNLTEALLNRSDVELVRVLDNFSTGYQHNIHEFLTHPKYEFVEGDIRNYEDVVKAVEGIEVISHQAALGSVPRSLKDPMTSNNANVLGSMNVFHAAKESGADRVVYASSSSVYGDDPGSPKEEDRLGNVLSPYAASKRSIELYAKAFSNVYPFRFIAMRYFNVFGPRQNAQGAYAAVIPQFITALLNGQQATIFGDGSQTRDFTFIDNVLQMNIKALSTDNADAFNRYYNVACGSTTSLNRVYAILAGCAGSDIKPHYTDPRQGDIKDSLANISLAQKHIGYKPEIQIEEGLIKTFDWFKKNQGE